jgi:hypothetical protein
VLRECQARGLHETFYRPVMNMQEDEMQGVRESV